MFSCVFSGGQPGDHWGRGAHEEEQQQNTEFEHTPTSEEITRTAPHARHGREHGARIPAGQQHSSNLRHTTHTANTICSLQAPHNTSQRYTPTFISTRTFNAQQYPQRCQSVFTEKVSGASDAFAECRCTVRPQKMTNQNHWFSRSMFAQIGPAVVRSITFNEQKSRNKSCALRWHSRMVMLMRVTGRNQVMSTTASNFMLGFYRRTDHSRLQHQPEPARQHVGCKQVIPQFGKQKGKAGVLDDRIQFHHIVPIGGSQS